MSDIFCGKGCIGNDIRNIDSGKCHSFELPFHFDLTTGDLDVTSGLRWSWFVIVYNCVYTMHTVHRDGQ